MENSIKHLEPNILWKYFHEITQVPRPSKQEDAIRDYVVAFGKSLNLETLVDQTGNVLIRKPGTKGYENRKMVVLQSHLDMVCEKNSDTEFDFMTDAIKTKIVDGWVKAEGTTLGADDGIGIATAMAILASNDIEHGPIEALFTVDEETGLSGAFGLTSDFMKSKILLNLDSEDEGELFIGCAGGRDTVIELPYELNKSKAGNKFFKISVSGLNGGHSGDDINKGLANANKLLNRILFEAHRHLGIELAEIDGGNLRNAIAREAFAVVGIDLAKAKELEAIVIEFDKIFKSEYHVTEKNVSVSIEESNSMENTIKDSDFVKLIHSIYSCPHGVLAMSRNMANFVETSTNLASIKTKDGYFLITTSQRSSVETALDDACNMVAANFLNVGAKTTHTDGYPGWTPNPDSEIVELTRKAYIDIFGKEPKVLAIHAGLECGLIGQKYPGLDMISYGPTIKGAHSPDERLKIDTVQMFWDLTLEVLKRIPNE